MKREKAKKKNDRNNQEKEKDKKIFWEEMNEKLPRLSVLLLFLLLVEHC